jgi:hypothetical protein
MIDTRKVRREMLSEPIDVHIGDKALDFDSAKLLADSIAKKETPDPMLLAWFDEKSWTHSPAIVCGCGDKPSWIVYAQSRGANITVLVNEGEYVFLYR